MKLDGADHAPFPGRSFFNEVGMRCRRPFAMLTVCLAGISGCAMCQSDLDHYYPAYGGLRARSDMVHGIVGSIIDPAAEVNGDMSQIIPYVPGEIIPASDDQIEPGSRNGSNGEGVMEPIPNGPVLRSPFPLEELEPITAPAEDFP